MAQRCEHNYGDGIAKHCEICNPIKLEIESNNLKRYYALLMESHTALSCARRMLSPDACNLETYKHITVCLAELDELILQAFSRLYPIA